MKPGATDTSRNRNIGDRRWIRLEVLLGRPWKYGRVMVKMMIG